MASFFRRYWKAIFVFAILLTGLGYSVGLVQKAVEWFTGASYTPAAIVVHPKFAYEMNRVWEGLAQGNEQENLRLTASLPHLQKVRVQYIRIDHVFDGFGVVDRGEDGRLKYDFTKLDAFVADILATGAKPYISLSYMPPAISRGDVTDLPKDWGEWGQVVAQMVAHYSRDYRGGIPNVVYEVWNEPDLFGGWKTYGDKNYLSLYRTAVNGAESVKGTKPFLIGGPATTGLYDNWITDYYQKTAGVRKDFFSWHRYSVDPEDYVKDAERVVNIMRPNIDRPQKIFISEWGVVPDKGSKLYDGRTAAAHFLAVSRALMDTKVDLVLAFEIQDGLGGTQWHGGWGMLTNVAYGAVAPKPRFTAYEMLNEMKGQRVKLIGEGSHVKAVASKENDGSIKIVLVNYDVRGKHEEIFPLTVTGMESGLYKVSERYLSGRRMSTDIQVDSTGNLKRQMSLGANEAVAVTLTKQ